MPFWAGAGGPACWTGRPEPVERRHAVSARGDNPLVVGADVVVGRRIIQRRVQNRRIDADVAQ